MKLILTVDEAIIVKEVFSNFVTTLSNINWEFETDYRSGRNRNFTPSYEIHTFIDILKKIENNLNQELKCREQD